MITTVDVFSVVVGELRIFPILVTDVNGDTFTLTFSGGVVNAASSSLAQNSSGQYSFSILISDFSELDVVQPLVFVVTDERNASSELVQRVEVCACVNDGDCTSDGILGTDSTIVQTCLCPDGEYTWCIFCIIILVLLCYI